MEPQATPENADEVVWTDAAPLCDLLGFDFADEGGQDRSGLNALINSALVSHPRLPMLDVIFERTARLMSTSLRQLTGENAEATLENVTSTRFSDFVDGQADSGIIGVIHAAGLDGYALIAVDSGLVHCVIDLLLGGRRAAPPSNEGRALTAIELGLAARLMTTIAGDLNEAFALVRAPEITLDRVETTPRFATITQDASVCALARLKVRIDDFAGRIAILAPHATLETVRDLLARDFIGASRVADDRWRRRLGDGVASAGVDLVAVLADRVMTIGDLGKLRSGETVTFSSGAEPHIELRAGGSILAKGRVGRLGETIAVRLDHAVSAEDLMRGVGDAA